MIDLSGRAALVTGSGSGIGRATALMLGRAGARVAAVELLPDRAEAIARDLAALGIECMSVTADVSRPEQIEHAVAQAQQRLGGLDIVVANAGISTHCRIVEMSDEDWDRTLAVDLDGVFYTLRASVPHVRQSAHGRIICTASHYGVIGRSGLAHYSAAKGGVIGLVRTLALEMGPYRVTVNAVAPGPIETNIVERTEGEVRAWEARLPLGRIGQPEDVAGAITFLASDLASWITGHVLQVNGGAFFQ